MANEMRDRLRELLLNTNITWDTTKIAEYLIENGVVVPPCKVGQTVYAKKGCFRLPYASHIKYDEFIPCEVIAIKETKKGKFILLKPLIEETFGMRSANGWFEFSTIGKTVFLTEPEAEQKLKEMRGRNNA